MAKLQLRFRVEVYKFRVTFSDRVEGGAGGGGGGGGGGGE